MPLCLGRSEVIPGVLVAACRYRQEEEKQEIVQVGEEGPVSDGLVPEGRKFLHPSLLTARREQPFPQQSWLSFYAHSL